MPFSCFLFHPRKSCEKRRKRSHTNVSNALVTRTSTPPAQTAHVRFCGRKWVHTRLCSKGRAQRLTRRNTGRFGWGVSLPSTRTARSRTSPGRVSERRTLPLLGLGLVCSRRTQRACGTAMRLCASLSRRRRGPAGLRDLFTFVEVAACTPCAQSFLCVRGRDGITTLGVLRMLLKRRTAACQSGSFSVSLYLLFTFAKDPAGCCQYPH